MADAPRSKEKVRPGDLPTLRPKGHLFGTPGPDAGYAMILAERFRTALDLAWQEHADDALAVGTAIAMKRAATFGRAPILTDVEFGLTLLGYFGDAPEDLVDWRRERVRDARHDYARQRELVDAVTESTMRLTPADVRARLHEWRALLQT
jgi:hypothetical protein